MSTTALLADALNSQVEYQDEYTEAERLHRQILLIREKVLGKKHPDTLSSMAYLADLLSSRDEYGDAERLHRQPILLRRSCAKQYQWNYQNELV